MSVQQGIITVTDGRLDLRRAAEDLARRLPDALAPLARLAFNYRWSWLPGGPELFRAVDAERFEAACENPVRLLQEISARRMAEVAADGQLVARAAELEAHA